jgi:hydroxyacylglutathione hydrolase
VKFAASISTSEAVKNLHNFAQNNEQTQGKFTIGDEKVWNGSNSALLSQY